MKTLKVREKNEHILNVFVSYELKKSIEELAEEYDRTVAAVVRSLLRLGLPLLRGVWKAEEQVTQELPQLTFRTTTRRSNRDEVPVDKGN